MQNFRPLFGKASQAMKMNQLRRMPQQTSLLLPAQQARFGGMMGMGELADVLAGKCDPNDAIKLWDTEDRVGILLTLDDRPGVLTTLLTS